MMRCANKNDWTILRDVEGSSGSYFSEEDVGHGLPEEESAVVDEV